MTEAAAKVTGEQSWDFTSTDGALSRAGDLDGDTCGDVILSAPNAGWIYEGASDGHGTVYVLFGPLSGTIAAGDAPVQLEGTGDDRVGAPLTGGGDVDGDGVPDFLVGGPGDDDGGEDAGAAWLVSGVSVL